MSTATVPLKKDESSNAKTWRRFTKHRAAMVSGVVFLL
ncbi:MAG: hypothetical protein RLZZ156_1951, partial [Deinococcota bacterium]